jgi:hypothetical protein
MVFKMVKECTPPENNIKELARNKTSNKPTVLMHNWLQEQKWS